MQNSALTSLPQGMWLLALILTGIGLTCWAGWFAMWFVPPSQYARICRSEPVVTWTDSRSCVFAIDARNGQLRRASATEYDTSGRMLTDHSWLTLTRSNRTKEHLVKIVELNTRAATEGGSIVLGDHDDTTIVGPYLVTIDSAGLLAYDLSEASESSRGSLKPIQLNHQMVGGLTSIVAVADQSRFVLSYIGVARTTHELYQIDQAGMRLLSSWQVGFDGTIDGQSEATVVVNAERTALELRSLVDGAVRASFPMPSDFDYSASEARYSQYYVSIRDRNKRTRHFHAATGQELTLARDLSLPDQISGTSLGLVSSFDTNDRVFIVDLNTNVLKWTFKYPNSNFQTSHLTPDHKVLIATGRMGITTYLYDLHSGQLIRWTQPFAWAPWLLAGLVAMCVAWVVSWRRWVMSNNWSPWWLYHVVLVWIVAVMTWQMWYVYGPSDLSRVPCAIAYGAILAALQMAALWLWIGRGSLAQRAVHLVFVFSVVGLSLRCIYPLPNSLPFSGTAIIYCLLPLIGMVLSPLCVVWTKTFRALRRQSKATASNSKFSMRALMYWTALFAILIAIYRSFLPQLFNVNYGWMSYDYFAASAFVAGLGWVLTFNHSPHMRHISNGFAWTFSLALFAYSLYRGVYGMDPDFRDHTLVFRAVALTTTYGLTAWMAPLMWPTLPWVGTYDSATTPFISLRGS